MNLLIEDGTISEMECGNNFAYILNDNSLFLSTDYKVLQSQKEGCFVKCMKLIFNGQIQFYYLTNRYKPLTKMISVVDADGFMAIITNLLSNILAVNQNGFLSCQNIDISFEKIFVDSSTYKVALIYLPISKRFHSDESTFENELRANLVKRISEMTVLSSPQIVQFVADLSNGLLSIKDLYDRIKGGKTFDSSGETSNRDQKGNIEIGKKLRIVAMNAPMRVEVEVTKDNFVIGKKAAIVDGVVSFNKMISRAHCRIAKENGQYVIADLQSANGTYVNGIKLLPNQSQQIKNGDIIRLANSDFQVVIS